MPKGASKSKTTTQNVVVEDPEELPSWRAPTTDIAPAPAEENALSDDFNSLFREVVDARPTSEHDLTVQANGIQSLATVLMTTRKQVDYYLGELAVLTEDFDLWRYYPGCNSIQDFWSYCGLTASVVKNAMSFFRHGVPLAEKLGIDLKTPGINGELSRPQTQAITTLAKKADKQKLMETQEGEEKVRETVQNILAAPTEGQVYATMREFNGKPERRPCYLRAEVLTDEFSEPRLRLSTEITSEMAEAWGQNALYFVVKLSDERTLNPSEVAQMLHELRPDDNSSLFD